MKPAVLLAALLIAAPAMAQAAPARLSEPEVRAFVARQSKLWNAGELGAYFALFTPAATFTDRGRAKDGREVAYGESTLAEARRQARKSLAQSKVQETVSVRSVRLAPDGRSARVESAGVTLISEKGRTRRICGERRQTVVATPRGLRSTGQVETIFECR
jgi:hypothetical protein